MQQNRQLPRDGDDRAFLRILTSALSERQAPTTKVRVRTERTKDVMGAAYEKPPQERVACFRDTELRFALA